MTAGLGRPPLSLCEHQVRNIVDATPLAIVHAVAGLAKCLNMISNPTLRKHMRGAVVLLRQLLLSLHHFAGEANDRVVLIGLSVNP
jgi:hypothetical protein